MNLQAIQRHSSEAVQWHPVLIMWCEVHCWRYVQVQGAFRLALQAEQERQGRNQSHQVQKMVLHYARKFTSHFTSFINYQSCLGLCLTIWYLFFSCEDLCSLICDGHISWGLLCIYWFRQLIFENMTASFNFKCKRISSISLTVKATLISLL